MKKKKTAKEVTVVGTVREIREDDEEICLEISADEDDYAVEMNKEGKKLLTLLGSDIEATGIVTQDDEGISRISISSFKLLERYDDEDLDNDEEDEPDYR